MAHEKSKEAMAAILSFIRALTGMYQHMHWRTHGEVYYADHLLFNRLYDETYGNIDSVAERTIGLFNDSHAIGPVEDFEKVLELLKSFGADQGKPELFPIKALGAEKMFLDAIAQTRKILESEDILTDGVDNLLQGIADLHESHTYLLQQRTNEKRGTMLVKLYKLAYTLDKKGHYSEADEIEAAMKSLADRVGLNIQDMVSLADFFDRQGEIELANRFDEMAKIAKGE